MQKNQKIKCVVTDGDIVFYFFCANSHKEAEKVAGMEIYQTFIIPEQNAPRSGGNLWLKDNNRVSFFLMGGRVSFKFNIKKWLLHDLI